MIYKPPTNYIKSNKPSVFLAGSIEMGKAEDWQTGLEKFFQGFHYDVLNPRRDDWDSSWVQTFENANFFQQVTWELNNLDKVDTVVIYFDPDTKSPISLLELGLYANSGKVYVICPDGFWRKGNIEVVCNKYNIPLLSSIEQFKKYFMYHVINIKTL